MDVGDFWTLVEATRAPSVAEQLDALDGLLESFDCDTLEAFRACHRGLMRYAYDGRLWDAGRIAWLGMDEATFFGLRAWLVAQGRDVFHHVLADPDRLASLQPHSAPAFALRIAEDPGLLTPLHLQSDSSGDDEAALQRTFPRLWGRHRSHPMQSLGHIDAATQWVYDRLRADGRIGLGAFVSQARGVGRARCLTGEVQLVVVGLDAPAARLAETPLKLACRVLVNEASRRGVDLRWRRTEAIPLRAPRLYDPVLGRVDPDALAALSESLALLAPARNGALVAVTREVKCPPVTWRANRFHRDRLEGSLISWKVSAATVTRQLLTQFGAAPLCPGRGPGSDLRAWILGHVAPLAGAALRRGFLADSVMTTEPRTPAVVDPLTALAVGWTDTLERFDVPLFELAAV